MREMLSPTSAIMGKGLGKEVALITDGRFSGGSHGFVVGHMSPEAALGGPLALVKNGDEITIDAQRREITLHVARRRTEAPAQSLGARRNPMRAAARWRSMPSRSAAHRWARSPIWTKSNRDGSEVNVLQCSNGHS